MGRFPSVDVGVRNKGEQMMPIKISNAAPDGLLVSFGEFYFDTWEEVFDFINKVSDLYHDKQFKALLPKKVK